MYLILFSVFINGLLREVEEAEIGIDLSSGGRLGGLLFVGVKDQLQTLIDVVHAYCRKWRLKANVSKSAVMVFSRESVDGAWKWGVHVLRRVSKYTYLGVLCMGCAYQECVRRKVNQLHSVICNRDINLSARRLLLLAVVRPTLEYGSEMWEANKTQAGALKSVMLGGAKRILGCSSKTCNEAVGGIWGLIRYKGVGIRISSSGGIS